MGGYRIVKKYRSKAGRRATVRQPNASRYDNDYYQKCSVVAPIYLDQPGIGGSAYVMANCNAAVSGIFHKTLFDCAEFVSIKDNFAYYEVVGMKAEASTYYLQTAASATAVGPTEIYGGNGRKVSLLLATNLVRLQSLPVQKIEAPGGKMAVAYWNMKKDIKNINGPTAVPADQRYSIDNGGIMYVRVPTEGFATVGTDVVGSCKFTWYVRFHGRTSL